MPLSPGTHRKPKLEAEDLRQPEILPDVSRPPQYTLPPPRFPHPPPPRTYAAVAAVSTKKDGKKNDKKSLLYKQQLSEVIVLLRSIQSYEKQIKDQEDVTATHVCLPPPKAVQAIKTSTHIPKPSYDEQLTDVKATLQSLRTYEAEKDGKQLHAPTERTTTTLPVETKEKDPNERKQEPPQEEESQEPQGEQEATARHTKKPKRKKTIHKKETHHVQKMQQPRSSYVKNPITILTILFTMINEYHIPIQAALIPILLHIILPSRLLRRMTNNLIATVKTWGDSTKSHRQELLRKEDLKKKCRLKIQEAKAKRTRKNKNHQIKKLFEWSIKQQELWKTGTPNTTTATRIINLNDKQERSSSKLIVPVQIDGEEIHAQLDTGAEVTILSGDIYEKISKKRIYQDVENNIILLDHNKKEIIQKTKPKILPIKIGGETFDHEVYISHNAAKQSLLLGYDIIKKAKININHDDNGPQVSIGERNIPLMQDNEEKEEDGFQAINETMIEPGEVSQIEVEHSNPHIPDGQYSTSDHPWNDESPAQLYSETAHLNNGKTILHVRNINTSTLTIPAGMKLAKIREDFAHANSISINDNDDNTISPTIDIEPHSLPVKGTEEKYSLRANLEKSKTFPPHLKEQFLKFVSEETPNLIAKSEFDIGEAKVNETMDIKLIDDEPICTKPYKLDSIRTQQLEKAMESLVENGIFEKGSSPYASPVFLVTKAADSDGLERLRLCCDNRKLNQKTVKEQFPLRNITSTLQQLQGHSHYSCVDLGNAFLNFKLSKDASLKAAVCTPNCTYLPKRCIFGLSGSPIFFAKMINKILTGLPVAWYQDDIAIFSSGTEEEHLELIKTVFRRLAKYNLRVNGKGKYFCKSLSYLGKIVSKDGLQVLPKHVEAINNFPRPASRKEVQRFLGITNYLSNFVHGYSIITRPLCQLLSEKTFLWQDCHENAFQLLKSKITRDSFIFHVDEKEPLYLCCDASLDDYASVLFQVKSYSKEDIPFLEQECENMTHFPTSNVKTHHPITPKPTTGIPKPLKLYGSNSDSEIDDSEEVTQNKRRPNISNRTPTPSLTEIMNEDDRVHLVRACGFHSSVFRGAQKNYSVLEKEATGLACSVEHFSPFLRHSTRNFILSDAQSLLWLLKFQNAGLHKLERIIIRLFSYDFKIIIAHVKGIFNIADKFTRLVPKLPSAKMADAKRAVVISSPFPIGTIVTPHEILERVKQLPDLVMVPSKPNNPTNKTDKAKTDTHDNTTTDSMDKKLTTNNIVDIQEIKTTVDNIAIELKESLSPANIIKAQRQDKNTEAIIKKLNSEEMKDSKYYLDDKNILMKKPSPDADKSEGKIVIPSELEGNVICLFHLNTHLGANKLSDMIRTQYYFKRIDEKTNQFTRACALCNQYKPSNQRKTELGHATLPETKAKYWHLDLVSGLPPTNGFNAYLSIVDPFSNFCMAVPCTNELTGKKTAKIIAERIISVFGTPKQLISDAGRNILANQFVGKMARFYGIEIKILTVNSPRTHGIVEAQNKKTSSLLKILTEQYEVGWPDIIDFVVCNLNSTPRPHTKMSPAYMMFGQENYDASLFNPAENNFMSIAEFQQFFTELNQKCKLIIEEANAEMREQNLLAGGVANNFDARELVYVKDFQIKPHKKYKAKYYSAPFVVLKDYGQSLLCKDFQGIVRVVHKSNVRKCPERVASQFAALPLKIKNKLGFEFDRQEIADAIINGEVPDFFKPSLPQYTPPTTRSRSQVNVDDNEQLEAQSEAEAISSDEDEIPTDKTIPASKTVTFNI